MCLETARFGEFAAKPLSNEHNTTSCEIAISGESREDVDRIVDAAMEAGATPARDAIDEGFMYGRSFHDIDGYLWAVMWMDTAAAFGE